MKTSPSRHLPMKISILLFGILVSAPGLHAATTYTFDPALTGSQSWSVPADWSSGTYPGASGNTDQAVIDRTTSASDLLLTTPSSATTVGKMTLTATATSGITLALGNTFNVNTNGQPTSVYSNSGDSTKLVFDLNGYDYNAIALSSGNNSGASATIGSTLNMTIKSSGSTGGTYMTNNYVSAGAGSTPTGAISIQDNATVMVPSRNDRREHQYCGNDFLQCLDLSDCRR